MTRNSEPYFVPDESQEQPEKALRVFDPVETQITATRRAEIDGQIATAKEYPRPSLERIEAKVTTMACRTPEGAAECFYVLPRGGKKIEGPSIRLAELIGMTYGNIVVTPRPPLVGEKSVLVEWMAIDLESNYATSGSVSTNILYGKNSSRAGQRYDEDMINTICLATVAKARRNGVYAVVPGILTKAIMAKARKVAVGGDRPIEARREMALAYFRKMGVDDAQILKALEVVRVEDIDAEKLADLSGFKTALMEGQTTLDELFPSPQATQAGAAVSGQGSTPAAQGQRMSFRPPKTAPAKPAATMPPRPVGRPPGPPVTGPPKPTPAYQPPPEDEETAVEEVQEPEAAAPGAAEGDWEPVEGEQTAQEAPAEPSAPPLEQQPWFRTAKLLAEKEGCAIEEAADSLVAFAPRLYKVEIGALNQDQLDEFHNYVADGSIRVKRKK